MTPTLSAPSRLRPPRWAGVAFGLLVGVLIVCHGCHVGDHDDELSAGGRWKPAEASSGRATDRVAPEGPRQ